jgi:cytochrome bd ubiquinol oxidase subunit II
MTLAEFWFLLIAIVWTGFFVLEGFGFGVGMLHAVVGRDEPGRRAAIGTIGPLWDGNEVWLIVAGAAMFAAFPAGTRRCSRPCTSLSCCCSGP